MNLPELKIRSFTTDQAILDKCFYSNYYKIKGVQKPEDAPVVVDLGAHCGFFAFSALALGAKKVYAFEPFLDNYKVLLENTKDGGDKAISYQLGIYTKNEVLELNYPEIKEGSYYDFSDLDEGSLEKRTSLRCPVFLLDYILGNLVLPNEDKVEILKLNLGYAETDILLASKVVAEFVENICLETKEDPPKIESFITEMKNRGYKESFMQKNQEDGTTLVIIGKDIKKYFNV